LVGVSTLRVGSGEAPPWVSDGKNRRSDPVYECQSSTSRGSSTSVRRLGFRTPAPRRAEGSPGNLEKGSLEPRQRYERYRETQQSRASIRRIAAHRVGP